MSVQIAGNNSLDGRINNSLTGLASFTKMPTNFVRLSSLRPVLFNSLSVLMVIWFEARP
jgi:hypothetical protein